MPAGAGAPCCDCNTGPCLDVGPDPPNATWDVEIDFPNGGTKNCHTKYDGTWELVWLDTTSTTCNGESATRYRYQRGNLPGQPGAPAITLTIYSVDALPVGSICSCELWLQEIGSGGLFNYDPSTDSWIDDSGSSVNDCSLTNVPDTLILTRNDPP